MLPRLARSFGLLSVRPSRFHPLCSRRKFSVSFPCVAFRFPYQSSIFSPRCRFFAEISCVVTRSCGHCPHSRSRRKFSAAFPCVVVVFMFFCGVARSRRSYLVCFSCVASRLVERLDSLRSSCIAVGGQLCGSCGSWGQLGQLWSGCWRYMWLGAVEGIGQTGDVATVGEIR